MTRRLVCIAAGAALLVAGCSSGGSSGGDAKLQSDVLALTQAAATHDWTSANAAMSRVRSDLAAAVANKQVSAAQAATIRTHLAAVAADVAARTSTPTPAPTTTRPTAKPTPKPAPRPPRDKHKGHGGSDHGGDGGD